MILINRQTEIEVEPILEGWLFFEVKRTVTEGKKL
jgi:hypothetical protein